jgi:hypothetical protein
MSLSFRLGQARRQKRQEQKGARADGNRAGSGARTWIMLGLCLMLAGIGTLAVFEFFIWNKIPPQLVGLWEIQEGPQKDSTFEFFRNGTMEVHLTGNKKEDAHKTQVTVRDRTLVETKKSLFTREEKTNKSLIRELTANTLILEPEKGEVLKLVRIE